ncbi:zinc finger BED domain-containing protein RICESLEEPER 3-like [Cucumis melo var. makuwa]|uniref:Zinc finger BED domain-containing protein RICESLEEPER 3-like n=1 Tax=Cucumis melo var. makuwa TaxID=1194695 RepID=A0A5A7TYZ6_CUCMM|nr:zinc finger BED domain-containing protein RICESLEEPER 3-like [Cucumis melo var. makuwa]TYK04070.1 zinc finger BED domain-containing protein RICESLEEPER 3-like [Cucumis melo var. makuwa]
MTLAFKLKDKFGDNSSQLVCESFSLEGCREALVEMIIVDELPFKFVNGKGFKKFVDKLTCGNHTRFVVPSQFTVARDVLKFFCPIENHKGDTIGKTIEKNLKDWGIERVMTLTVDNASSNDTAVAYLLKRFNKGLLFGGIRYAVRFIRSSPARFLKFKKCIELEKIACKSYVCLDVPTRWNSTYMMLEAAVKFEKAFDRLEDEDAAYRHDMSPNKEDWTNARI